MNTNSFKQFVIQKHSRAGEIHWDLMLETDDVLQTFRLSVPPEKLPRQANTAAKIFDHPIKFLTYQGPVNNGKGRVEIADAGTYQPLSEGITCRQLQFDGKMLKGRFTLTCIEGNRWEFKKSHD